MGEITKNNSWECCALVPWTGSLHGTFCTSSFCALADLGNLMVLLCDRHMLLEKPVISAALLFPVCMEGWPWAKFRTSEQQANAGKQRDVMYLEHPWGQRVPVLVAERRGTATQRFSGACFRPLLNWHWKVGRGWGEKQGKKIPFPSRWKNNSKESKVSEKT